ncbi:MAG: hypothetical protein ACREC8_02170 [Limisphaerales bacterium]
MAAGASLVQIYTGLVFEGPGIIKKIVAGLIQQMKTEGKKNLPSAIGSIVQR